MITPPSEFPHVVCWNRSSCLDVTNTVALSVRASVFNATHFQSPIRRLNVAATPPTTAAYSENELLSDFLVEGRERLFCVAVGDSGSGKSHLIRWLWQQAETRMESRWQIVRIPRHAANLADVLRCILAENFKGEEVDRIRREIQHRVDVKPQGARVKVLDALAFVLDPQNREKSRLNFPDDEEHQDVILPLLPAMLHDAAIREHLFQNDDAGIVSRLAQHVMGTREERLAAAPNLKWASEDLNFPPRVTKRAGNNAAQLANWLFNDEGARTTTAEVLNRALDEAWPTLVGLQRGNLRGAMLEIRRQLKAADKELLLFLEDLSVSQGIDAELIESLIVKPSEENNELCVLRSIVGLTNEDFRVMPSNIKSRLDLAVSFDVPLGESENYGLGPAQLADFASRYLNASRYTLTELDEWDAKSPSDRELPSFCEESHCPNLARCHRNFGHVNGRGLYPLNTIALERLYTNLQGEERASFNPRILVGQVLAEFLKRAEAQIAEHSFPGLDIREWFRLRLVGADVEARLNQKHGLLAPRIRTAMEIYAEQPWRGALATSIAETFGLPGEQGNWVPEPLSKPQPTKAGGTPTVSSQDAFDIWFNEKRVDDGELNGWRKSVFDAISGARDWDSDPLGPLFFERFKRAYIHFEGQHVAKMGDVKIVIKPSAEAAVALRGLVRGFQNREEMLLAVKYVDEWTEEVCSQLRSLRRTPGARPLAAAVHLLALGALVRGLVPPECDRVRFLQALFENWPDTVTPVGPNASSWAQLREAFGRWGPKLREWLLRQIGGSKGGRVGTVIIDVAHILDDVISAQRRVHVEFGEEFGRDWDRATYEPLLDLATRVTKHLKSSLAQEEAYCKHWLALLHGACGGYSTRDLGVLLKEAFASAREANAFNNPRVAEYALRCENFAAGNIEQIAETARGVISEKARNHRLQLLARLNRKEMDEAAETLGFAQMELRRADEFLDRKLRDSAAAELRQLEQQVSGILTNLRQQLQSLVEENSDE